MESKQSNKHDNGDNNENDNEEREERCTVKLEMLRWLSRNGLNVVAIAYSYWKSIAAARSTRAAPSRVDDRGHHILEMS